MRMRTLSYLVLAIALTLGAGARAEPPNGGWHRPDREQRLQMMQKIHTGFILELGQLLALDTSWRSTRGGLNTSLTRFTSRCTRTAPASTRTRS
jgi:hypothetical protein